MTHALDCFLAPVFAVVDFTLDAPGAAVGIAAALTMAGMILLGGW